MKKIELEKKLREFDNEMWALNILRGYENIESVKDELTIKLIELLDSTKLELISEVYYRDKIFCDDLNNFLYDYLESRTIIWHWA